jgi:FixJ family two-component response regulator
MPGCQLLDVRMPGMSGLELQKELERRGSSLPIVFMTGHGDVPMAVDAMRGGAVNFLQKPFRDDDLLESIHKAMTCYRQQSDQAGRRDRQRERISTLTPRELEVARRIAKGQANKVIAADLDISLRTVEQHRANLMDKLNVRTVADLVRLMIDEPG